MRWSRALTALALALFVVACGGQPASDAADGDGDGDSTEESQPAEESQGDGGGGGGNGGGGGDLEGAFDALIPPSSTELTKTTAEGVIFAAYETDEDYDSLVSFYEDAIADLGMEIFSTTEAQGGISWIFTEDEGSGYSGSISIFPASDGSGNQISIQLGEGT